MYLALRMTFFMQKFNANQRKEIVFVIDEKIIDNALANEILSKLPSNKKVGLDMKKVECISSQILIEYLLNNKIKLFNLQSEVLAYFSLIFKNGNLNSFVNYSDFKENKRELIRRNFLIA